MVGERKSQLRRGFWVFSVVLKFSVRDVGHIFEPVLVKMVSGYSGPLAFLVASQALSTSIATCNWSLVWADEFERATGVNAKISLDTSKWTVEQTDSPHNNELQAYVDSMENVWEGSDG